MKNVAFILSGLAVLSSCARTDDEGGEKKNVLFIAIDDLKPVLGCYGDAVAKTPNIDRLAGRSTVFESNYCQQAVSGATRSSLLTGLRPDHTHVYDLQTKIREKNPNVVTIPQHFKNEGYVTSGIGKVFQSTNVIDEDNEFSWSIPYLRPDSFYNEKTGMPALEFYQNPVLKKKISAYAEEAEAKGIKKENGEYKKYLNTKDCHPISECLDLPDEAYADGAIALCALDQLKKLKDDGRPFFFAVGFHKPHLPFVAPRKYWDLYDRESMPVAEFQEHAAGSPELAYHNSIAIVKHSGMKKFCKSVKKNVNHIGIDIEKQKELIHGYYACVSYVDAQVGKLLDILEELDLTDNTVVVLWGDHGWHLGDHDLWTKRTNFEEATRAPLLIAAPGIEGHHTKMLSEFADVYPTLCELAGISTPEFLDGKSLVPLMKDGRAVIHEYAQSQFPRWIPKDEARRKDFKDQQLMGYTIRTDRYRYTMWMGDFKTYDRYSDDKVYAEELYDYREDPLETRNHVNEEAYAGARKEMKAHMLEFFSTEYGKGLDDYN